MRTNKIFWQNPQLTEIDATVTSANGELVTLDKTIAFAFAGAKCQTAKQ